MLTECGPRRWSVSAALNSQSLAYLLLEYAFNAPVPKIVQKIPRQRKDAQ